MPLCRFLLYVTWTMQFIFSGQGAAPPPWSWRGASSETRVFGTSTRWEATVTPWPPWSWVDLLRVAQLQVWGTHSWWSPRDVRYTELDVLGVHFAIGGLTGIHTHTHTHTRWWQSSQGPRPGFPGLGGGRPFARFPEAIQMLGFFLQLCLWTLWCPKMVGGDYDLDPRGLGGRLRGSIKLFQNISLSKIFCCIHRYQTC